MSQVTTDREQSLQERVAELERAIDRHELVDPLEMAAMRQLLVAVAGYRDADASAVPDGMQLAKEAADRLERLEETAERADQGAETAIAIAGGVESADESDTEVAVRLSKHYLIKEAADAAPRKTAGNTKAIQHNKASVTNPRIQEMAEPDHDLEWATVDHAWGKITANWECFERTKSDDGTVRLQLVKTPPKPLVQAAERDLARDDFAKEFFGESASEGVSTGGK